MSRLARIAHLYVRDVERNAATGDERPRHDSTAAVGSRVERLITKIIAIEFLTIAATGFLTSMIYFYAVLTTSPPTFEYVTAALLIAFLVSLLALGFKQYVRIQSQPRDRFMWSGLGAVALGFSLFLSFLFLFKIGDWYSRGTFFTQFLCICVALLLARGWIHSHVRRAIQSGLVKASRAVLIGDVKSNSHIVQRLERHGVHRAGVLSLPAVHSYPVSGVEVFSPGIKSFVERCRGFKPDDIVFLADTADLPRIVALVGPLSELPASVHIIPTASAAFLASAKVANLGETATI